MERARIVAAAGGVVLLASMWMAWYGIDVSGGAPGVADLASDATTDAWQSLEWIDLVLAATGILAIAWALLGRRAPAPVRRELVLVLALASIALIAFRLIDIPLPELDTPLVTVEGTREAGGFVALVGSVLTAFGALARESVRPA